MNCEGASRIILNLVILKRRAWTVEKSFKADLEGFLKPILCHNFYTAPASCCLHGEWWKILPHLTVGIKCEVMHTNNLYFIILYIILSLQFYTLSL